MSARTSITRARHWLATGLTVAVTVSLLVLVALEIYQVTLRYVFSIGVPWGRDVSGMLLFSLAWLGLPLLWLQRSHLAVDILPLTPGTARIWSRVLDGAAFLVALMLASAFWGAMQMMAFIDLPAIGVSAQIRVYPLFAGACLLALASALNLFEPSAP